MIETVIVEDNIYMLNHLRELIGAQKDFRVAALFKDSKEAEEYLKHNRADLLLMDVQTQHNHSGIASASRIREYNKNIKTVVVTSLIDPEILRQARQYTDSLWYKDHGDADILDVIRRTLDGERIFPDSSPNVELKDMFSDQISPRQMSILRLFVKGMTYDEIAEELKLTKSGVRWNLEQIVEKGGFSNKHELLAAVIENKLIVTTLKDE